jgi:hypothetical protein
MVQPTEEFIAALEAVPAQTALEQLIKRRALSEAGASPPPRYPDGVDYVRVLEEVRDTLAPDAEQVAFLQAALDALG